MIDALVLLVIGALLAAVYGSWLFSYCTPKANPIGTNPWFSMPAWAQIAVGLAISIVGAFACFLLWTPLPLAVSQGISSLLRIGGFVLILVGVMLWFWSRWMLGAMMGFSTTSAVQLQREHHLVQTGPYALVRHPMYLAYWLVLGGLLIMYRTWTPLILLLLMLLLLTRRAQREDQALESEFGDTWRHYAERVPMGSVRDKSGKT